MKTLTTALVLSAVAAAMQLDADPGRVQVLDEDWLQYDDGTPGWLTWTGGFRGVWFDTGDFYPSPVPFTAAAAELWFYHHSYYPWDTSFTIVELWNGDPSAGFTEFLGSAGFIAVHYAPSYAVFDPPVYTEPDFWCMQNTEQSTGGWPSILSDSGMDSPPGIHSYLLDGASMVPYVAGNKYCNFFIRVTDAWVPLERTSWGELKALFQ